MSPASLLPPVVMTFSGNDPGGGAGMCADIEALVSHGCHPAPVITTITIQDSTDVKGFAPLDPGLVEDQARAVLEDMPVSAFKIGLLGSVEIAEVLQSILKDYEKVPVVLDPVIASGSGNVLADDDVLDAMSDLLFPLTTVLTPNSMETRALAPQGDTLDACAMALLDTGCEYLLVTGTHENTPRVTNTLYGNRRELETFTWERLPHSYHGSGCTLAASIAGLLAQGLEPFSAIHEAQEYTWESLQAGYRSGMGQHIPNRLYWAQPDDGE